MGLSGVELATSCIASEIWSVPWQKGVVLSPQVLACGSPAVAAGLFSLKRARAHRCGQQRLTLAVAPSIDTAGRALAAQLWSFHTPNIALRGDPC